MNKTYWQKHLLLYLVTMSACCSKAPEDTCMF